MEELYLGFALNVEIFLTFLAEHRRLNGVQMSGHVRIRYPCVGWASNSAGTTNLQNQDSLKLPLIRVLVKAASQSCQLWVTAASPRDPLLGLHAKFAITGYTQVRRSLFP